MRSDYSIRPARLEEKAALEALIALSSRRLSKEYTPEEIEAALAYLYGADSELIADGTYFVVERQGEYLACGGWSKRCNICGGDRYAYRGNGMLDPQSEPAKIRAFFVHPNYARQGIASALLRRCEQEAKESGFSAMEIMATLPGIKLYEKYGYCCDDAASIFPLPDGTQFTMVRMYRQLD